MADHKFTLEEILREYDSDGKRSGIRREEDRPLSHGTLETEKLVTAATSSRPISQERAGYHAVEPVSAPTPEEDLVDIKSTISHIKANKAAQAALDAGASPVLRERFPTQKINRGGVSYLQSADSRTRHSLYPENDGYDNAVKLAEPDEPEQRHQPSIRQMQDSTRAKEKQRRGRRKTADVSYAKKPAAGAAAERPVPHKNWEEEEELYYGEKSETKPLRNMRQRVRRQTFQGDAAALKPDNMDLVRKTLRSLRSVIFFRFVTILVLLLIGTALAVGEVYGGGVLVQKITPRIFAGLELALGAVALSVSFPTVKNGIRNFLRFHADTDSMAVLPLIPAMIAALMAVIWPDVMAQEMVHLYMPCALLAMFCNALGRLLVVRRALRNCNVISHDGQKRVLSYVSQEDTAEQLTRGVIHDFPVVAAVRRADSLCDFLRYTYSTDMADAFCRPMLPITVGLSLVIAVGLTVIRMGTAFHPVWFSVFLSMLTLFLTAGCCVGSALVVNLPLERESKKAAATDSAMLGYQSVDDFFDMNALLVEATDLFPKGSVQIQGMKVFSGAKVDEVLLDAASLVQHADSMLQSAFAEMIPDRESLRSVEEYVCEDGQGLCGWIANRRVLLGGREMMASHSVEGLPTKTREAELAEGSGDVIYLSVSGVLSAMFSIRILPDPGVLRQMRALKQEQIALVIRTVDHAVTLRRLSSLFDYPEHLMKIVPTSMHQLFSRETSDLGCVSASMTVGGTGFGAAYLLLGARRVRRAALMGVILQVVSALLGLSLAMIHVVTGAYGQMTAQFFLLYHLIMTAVTALAVRIR